MPQSESIAHLMLALAKAQKAITSPSRNREVTVTPRSGGTSYKFSYTTLDALIDHVRGPLTENGLWFVQTTDSGKATGEFYLKTTLAHESGEWISGEMPMADPGTNQQLGSALTYQRRYALAAILGIASDMDDDGNAADGNSLESTVERGKTSKAEALAKAKNDEAKQAAVNFAQMACVKLEKMTSREELEKWRNKETLAKIERLRDYDIDLYQMVVQAVHETVARLS